MRLLYFLLCLKLSFALLAAESAKELAPATTKSSNDGKLAPGPNDANIAKLVARIIEKNHYLQQPFNNEIAGKFLDRYLDSFDPAHIYFVKADLDEFEKYRTTLDERTLRAGDTSPGFVIFNRFLERLQQQCDYATNLLQSQKFEFTSDDRMIINRRKEPRPADLAEAKKLWLDRLRYEYLQEKLGIGRPAEIAATLLEKLKQKKPREIVDSIQAGKRKADELTRIAREASKTNRADGEIVIAPAKARQTNEITRILWGKLSDDKVEELAESVGKRLASEKPEDIVESVRVKLERDSAEEIVKVITRRYARILKAYRELDSDDVIQIYLSALTHVYDPHSDYQGKSENDNFNISMRLSLVGIGAMLRSEDGYCKIQSLVPGGPAAGSKKLKPNDKIIAVAQAEGEPVDVVDMKLRKVVELIRGTKGTEVRLTVIPADAPDPSVRNIVSLIRDEIKLEDQEAKAKIFDLPVDPGKSMRLGVINLPSFYEDMDRRRQEHKSTTTDVAKFLKKFKAEKTDGVILDLRGNGGGSLEESINLTGLFIKEGPVVQVRDPDGKVSEDRDRDPSVLYDGPLIVLTSRHSASASEILAGALQDYGRALIVGDSSTHGKGTVQTVIQLKPIMQSYGLATTNEPGALKITIRKFYRASGSSTQLKGVVPDIILPSPNNEAEIGEASLENPLKWDTIASAKYDKLDRIAPLLDELRKRSEKRVATDKDFDYLREEIERYKKLAAEKTVSLNEEQRLKEKKEAEMRAKARKKDLAVRGEPPGKVYDLTLKLTEQPGLPPPLKRTNSVATVENSSSARDREVALDDNDVVDDQVPAVDITLDEAKRILADLVALTAEQKGVAAKR